MGHRTQYSKCLRRHTCVFYQWVMLKPAQSYSNCPNKIKMPKDTTDAK